MKKEYNVTLLCEITVEANSEAGGIFDCLK